MKTRFLFFNVTVFLLSAGISFKTVVAQEQVKCSGEPKIEIKHIEAQKALVVKADVPTSEIGPKMGELYGLLFGYLGQNQLQPAGPAFAVYYSFDPQGNTVFEAGVPILAKTKGNGEVFYKEFEGMNAVSTLYIGPYEKMEPVYIALDKFIKDNNLKEKGISWEVYLTDPMAEPDPNKYQTLIYFPVE